MGNAICYLLVITTCCFYFITEAETECISASTDRSIIVWTQDNHGKVSKCKETIELG